MKAEILTCSNDHILSSLLYIDKKSFPEDWFYSDAEEYYKDKLSDVQNIKIVLTEMDRIIGFSISIPHNQAVEELIHADKDMREDSVCRYYIESFVILPEFRNGAGFLKIGHKLIEELKRQHVSHISLHARVHDHNVSGFVKKYFTVTKTRRIPEWEYYNYKQPADYIEATL